MKYRLLYLHSFLIIISFLAYQCKNDSYKPKVKNDFSDSKNINDCRYENEILNQIFPSLFDSLNKISEIRNGTVVCYSDSLISFEGFTVGLKFIHSQL